jgi:imidazolonepropionase-like amidohydrolase
MGRLSGAAERVIDADGKVIAPGFIDNHCHYDAQVTWDPAVYLLMLSRRDQCDYRQLLARGGAGAEP